MFNLLKFLPVCSLCLSLSFSYGQSDIEFEIITSLIQEEFNPQTDKSEINDNSSNSDFRDQEIVRIVMITETNKQTINTDFYSLEKFQESGLSSLDDSIMNDFIEKNQVSINIPEFSLDQIKIIFMHQKKWDELIEQGGWNKYHKLYGPIPTIKLSRPGVNESMDKAFIYYDSRSDKLGGSGFYLILEKAKDKWIVKEKMIAWIS